MGLTQEQIAKIEAAGIAFLAEIRPDEELRHELDINYRIEDQSVYVFEIRPFWNNPSEMHETPIAKATYIKTRDCWKVFWMPSDLKWHAYAPATVKSIKTVFRMISEDKHYCFFG
jgi:hypothetical protein